MKSRWVVGVTGLIGVCLAISAQAAVVDISASMVDPTFDGYAFGAGSYAAISTSSTSPTQGWYASPNCVNDYQLAGTATRQGATAGAADSGSSFWRVYMPTTASSNTWIRTSSAILTLQPGNTYSMQFRVRKESAYAMADQLLLQLPEAGVSQMYLLGTDYAASTDWQTLTYTYVYDGTTTKTTAVRIFAYRTTATNTAVDIDTFSAVPEPATLAVLGLGAMGLLRRNRA